ncbi:MAG TPA: hypothetical protein VHL11_02415 [Phototrophicaceae bacterium]|jgi:hypothetical protein|nr:hypothetical protein [Phototrophicaceae bacterium]
MGKTERTPVKLERADLQARYQLFNKFALTDQRSYYDRTRDKYHTSTMQVNRIRATLGLMTGICSALAGFIVQIYFVNTAPCATGENTTVCGFMSALVIFLTILAVILPAFAALFNTLADLYQWDRQIEVYDAASKTLEVADAQSPMDDENDEEYRAALIAYAEGTLSVMSDETAQWGQSIRTPKQLEDFIETERKKVGKYFGDTNETTDNTSDNTGGSITTKP